MEVAQLLLVDLVEALRRASPMFGVGVAIEHMAHCRVGHPKDRGRCHCAKVVEQSFADTCDGFFPEGGACQHLREQLQGACTQCRQAQAAQRDHGLILVHLPCHDRA
ncbi:hypothetical protein D3C75_874860 [compost metagenome]